MRRRSFICACAAVAAPAEPPSALPPFRWDTVPLFSHLGKKEDQFTHAEAGPLARFPMVRIEKGQAGGAGATCEEGAFDAARGIRAHNGSMKMLFYRNLASDQIEFPLAAFLVGPNRTAASRMRAEYDRRLGPPGAPLRRNGWWFGREFRHAGVEADLGNEWGRIEWS
jgi:hypothetical protein